MKEIPIRFNLSNSEERLDTLKILLEVMTAEGELKEAQEIIGEYVISDKKSQL